MTMEHDNSFKPKFVLDVPLSTSNLYKPDKNSVEGYIKEAFIINEEKSCDALVRVLEDRLAEYHHAEYCVAFSSGYWALIAAITNRALPDKSEVIIPSLTYRRLADVVHWAGLTPVFSDIEIPSLSMTTNNVIDSFSENTGLILAVHPIVNCCDVHSLIELANDLGVPIIFDAVESVHEVTGGKRIGSFGVGEIFSLHASKLLNGIEGGYICTNDSEFVAQLRVFRDNKFTVHADRALTGFASRMHNIHAAFALACLDEIDKNVSHNKKIYEEYCMHLSDVDGVKIVKFDSRNQTSYKNIVIEVEDSFPFKRDKLVSFLNQENILARPYYYPPLHKKKYSYKSITRRELKNTDWACERYVNLPCGSRVTIADVNIVCDAILRYSRM